MSLQSEEDGLGGEEFRSGARDEDRDDEDGCPEFHVGTVQASAVDGGWEEWELAVGRVDEQWKEGNATFRTADVGLAAVENLADDVAADKGGVGGGGHAEKLVVLTGLVVDIGGYLSVGDGLGEDALCIKNGIDVSRGLGTEGG